MFSSFPSSISGFGKYSFPNMEPALFTSSTKTVNQKSSVNITNDKQTTVFTFDCPNSNEHIITVNVESNPLVLVIEAAHGVLTSETLKLTVALNYELSETVGISFSRVDKEHVAVSIPTANLKKIKKTSFSVPQTL